MEFDDLLEAAVGSPVAAAAAVRICAHTMSCVLDAPARDHRAQSRTVSAAGGGGEACQGAARPVPGAADNADGGRRVGAARCGTEGAARSSADATGGTRALPLRSSWHFDRTRARDIGERKQAGKERETPHIIRRNSRGTDKGEKAAGIRESGKAGLSTSRRTDRVDRGESVRRPRRTRNCSPQSTRPAKPPLTSASQARTRRSHVGRRWRERLVRRRPGGAGAPRIAPRRADRRSARPGQFDRQGPGRRRS